MSVTSDNASTWVLKVLMDKQAYADRREFAETYELYLQGRKVNLERNEGNDTVVVYVATAQELVSEKPSMSPRVFTFDALHQLATRSGLDFIGLVTYDLVTEVAFEYTWVRDRLNTVDSALVCADCNEPRRATHSDLNWN